ncbi:hypothetical protein DEO23_15655 [Brachybacterium endophyticum]|uniref:Uncharacterized protein n=1 Tax=Brachybacterium endophyticum TaxID=2182385 RepID=A0A2U2RGH5_9MICO|nr:hypothetical protein DEO23_15655 [Brachybacterium endophyticum]
MWNGPALYGDEVFAAGYRICPECDEMAALYAGSRSSTLPRAPRPRDIRCAREQHLAEAPALSLER